MEKVMDTPHCKFWIGGAILFFVYKSIPYMDLSIAKKVVSSRLLFQQGDYYYIYCDTCGIQDSTKAARDYLAVEGSALAHAIAVYDNRGIGKFMLNYYLLRNQPVVPTAFFEDREAAIIFLKDKIKS